MQFRCGFQSKNDYVLVNALIILVLVYEGLIKYWSWSIVKGLVSFLSIHSYDPKVTIVPFHQFWYSLFFNKPWLIRSKLFDTNNSLLVYVSINNMAEEFSEIDPTIIHLKEIYAESVNWSSKMVYFYYISYV
jgi:hypothetical protein